MSPTRAELLAAEGTTVPDVIGPGLAVLFCGINPGLWTAWSQHHFGRPGNRFWPALHRAGFTPRQLDPAEQHTLLDLGLGITNVVERATATAAEVSRDELRAGGERLVTTVRRHRPTYLAVLGVTAYRAAFDEPKARLGEQERTLGATCVWVLPNPSGLNAHFQLPQLAEQFAALREAAALPDLADRPVSNP